MVKSKTEFAMFTKGANGKGEWKGNLTYMKPGDGYMLKRQRETRTSFSYPFMEVNASIPFLEGNDGRQESASDSRETGGVTRGFANNMTLAAMTDGVSLQEGDRLIALAEAEVRGEALVGDSVVYMTISGDQQTPLVAVAHAHQLRARKPAAAGGLVHLAGHQAERPPRQAWRIYL